jgi:hypothetical protein
VPSDMKDGIGAAHALGQAAEIAKIAANRLGARCPNGQHRGIPASQRPDVNAALGEPNDQAMPDETRSTCDKYSFHGSPIALL